MEQARLCQFCQDALLRSFDNAKIHIANVYVGAHETIESFITASDLGCVLCSTLWQALSPAQRAAIAVHEEPRENITDLQVKAIDAPGPGLIGSWHLWARMESGALSKMLMNEDRLRLFLLSPTTRRSNHLSTVHLAERKQKSQNIITRLPGRHRLVQQRLGKQHYAG